VAGALEFLFNAILRAVCYGRSRSRRTKIDVETHLTLTGSTWEKETILGCGVVAEGKALWEGDAAVIFLRFCGTGHVSMKPL